MKKTFLLLTSCLWIMTGNAQVFFHDIKPDSTVMKWDAYKIKPSNVTGNEIIIWWHPGPDVLLQVFGDCEIVFDAPGTLPAKLNSGDSITPSRNWVAANYDPLSASGMGNWQSNATDKYLGFRFKNADAKWYYGWLKMTIAAGGASFTVQEWAYETTGKKINAGQKTASGSGITGTSADAAITIAPNPCRDQIIVNAYMQGKIYITDIKGSLVYNAAHNNGASTINTKEWAPGNYFIRLDDGNTVYTGILTRE